MERILFVNADDFGMSESINKAINECFKRKIINRTTLMVNTKDTLDAVELSKREGYFNQVGLHFNLILGEPILKETASSKICTNGCFNEELLKPKYNFFLPYKLKKVIRNEAEAQILRYLSYGYTANHIDSHHHIHIKIPIYLAIKPLLKKYGFKSVRIAPNYFFTERSSIIKKIYRGFFNHFIINYRVEGENVRRTKLMGCIKDYFSKNEPKEVSTEIMVHPDYINFKLIDLSNNIILDKYQIKGEVFYHVC